MTIGWRPRLIACAVVIIGGYLLSDVRHNESDYDSAFPSAPVVTAHKVEYRVDGSAERVLVTATNAGGGTGQGYVNIPWKRSFTCNSGDFLSISAQNQGETGTVVTSIILDDHPFKKSQSAGAYVIADCNAEAP